MNATRIISAPRLLVDGRITGPGAVVVAEGSVVEVRGGRASLAPGDAGLHSGLLTPGLVDLQVNGGYGVDLFGAAPADWEQVAASLPSTGVTAFLPTFVTAPVSELGAALTRTAAARDRLVGSPAARIVGAHLEGPFLNPVRAGAHDAALMVDPTPGRLDELLAGEDERRVLAVMTLAPERRHALDAVRRLAAAGVVVSVGHSDATAAQTTAAADAGARLVTHLFNAQSRLGHHEPGVPGAALADPRYTLGLVVDLRHVAPEVVRVVLAAATGRVALVSDATAAAGMPPGRYVLGGAPVVLTADDPVPRRSDGTIAGSALRLDAAVRNLVALGIPLAAALEAATRVPADAIGRRDLGRIAPGAAADLVWWDDTLVPQRAWIGGREVATRSR